MAGLGDEFRASREARHLSLSDVSEQIHIRSIYLQSIEEEDWAAIGAPVYIRGFIRTYARFLGLDAERAVGLFNASYEGPPAAEAKGPAPAAVYVATHKGPSLYLWLAAGAAVLLVAYVGYTYFQVQVAEPVPAPKVAAASPSPAASAAPSPAASPQASTPAGSPAARATALSRQTLELRLTGRSWLLVAVDGSKALEGIFPAGTRREFHGRSASVRAGNAGGVDVFVNGKDQGKMGNPGDVVQRTFPLVEE
jgi:cytoskeletal protein RodZ